MLGLTVECQIEKLACRFGAIIGLCIPALSEGMCLCMSVHDGVSHASQQICMTHEMHSICLSKTVGQV